MISDTLREGLGKYGIGEKLRALRLKKSMGLVELSQHTGLSPALLSKLERGKLIPTLPTLMRIALVFNKELGFFFKPEERALFRVHPAESRVRLPEGGAKNPAYVFENLAYEVNERLIDPYWAEFVPHEEPSALHSHPGFEFLVVVTGKLEVRHQDRTVELGEGDAVYFDSGIPHSYRCVGKSSAFAVVVTTDRMYRKDEPAPPAEVPPRFLRTPERPASQQ